MGWYYRGYNSYLVCIWINVGKWCHRSKIDPADTCVCDHGVGGRDIRRKGGSTARTR